MADIKSLVEMTYKVDTKQARQELKKLSGEEKKRHKEMIEQVEEQNDSLDMQLKAWGKLAAGVGAAAGAFAIANEGFETYATNARLRAANVNTNIDGLRKATRGLVDDTRLLEFSAAAMNGTFKLSQEQTEAVLRGALALRKTAGVDLPTALERLQQAVKEGSVEPLKELGIVLDTTHNDSMQGALDVIDAVSKEYDKLGGKVDLVTDRVDAQKVDFANAMDSIKESIGKVVIALAPLVEMAAELAGIAKELVGLMGGADLLAERGFGAAAGLGGIQIASNTNRAIAQLEANSAGFSDFAAAALADAQSRGSGGRRVKSRGRSDGIISGHHGGVALSSSFIDVSARDVELDRQRNKYASEKKQGGGGFDIGGNVVDPATQEEVNRLAQAKLRELDIAMQMAIAEEATKSQGSAQSFDQGAVFNAQLEKAVAHAREVQMELQLQENKNLFERIFGEPAVVDWYEEGIQRVAGAMDTLANASAAAFDTWITGSGGAAAAFKMFVAESLRALAKELLVNSVKYAAMGTASLFTPGMQGMAAGQFKASAIFAGGAVLAGAAAKEMGAGGGGGGGVPSRPAPPATSGLGSGGARMAADGEGGGRTTVVLLDDGFDSMSVAARKNEIRRRMRLGGLTFESDVVERR